jgi:uncharacterized protein (DUF362 family)
MAQVAITKAADYDEAEKAVREAVGLLGGMKKFVHANDIVVVKPNSTAYTPPQAALTTHPAVVAALVKLAKEASAKKVIVGDDPAFKFHARMCFDYNGIEAAARDAGAEVSYFDEEPHVQVKVPDGVTYEVVELPKPVVDADVVISTAKMKTHTGTVATLCIKNLHGLNTWEDKKKIHKTDVGQKFVDLAKAIKEKLRLSVVDGIRAMEGQGPSGGLPVDMGLFLAGDNIVAVDAVASACMGIDPMEVPTTQIAMYEGLGPASLHEITVKGEKIKDVARPFKRAFFQLVSRDPNVTVYWGGACLGGCLHMVERQYDYFSRDPNKKYAIIIGMNPTIPRKNLNVDEVWVTGDCAISCVKKMDFQPRPTKLFEGCPPLNDQMFDQLCKLTPEIFPEGHPRVSGRGIWVPKEEFLAHRKSQEKNKP